MKEVIHVSYKLPEEFVKYDSGKLRWSLLPWKAVSKLAEVIEYGAKKYAPNNWRKADDLSRYEDALLRHVVAHLQGEKLDPESGLPHLAHALCNAAFLLELKE
jgi:hypothetical protein